MFPLLLSHSWWTQFCLLFLIHCTMLRKYRNVFSSVFSSVQLLSCVRSFRPHESQHARPPCPSPTPRVHPNPCPSSWWCHPAISSSVIPFSSCPQAFPASGSFPMSQLFASGGQSIGVSASASVLPMNIQDWSPLGWTGWIFLQSKELSRVFSNTIVQKHQFFGTQLSSLSNSHILTWPLEKPWPWLDGPLLVSKLLSISLKVKVLVIQSCLTLWAHGLKSTRLLCPLNAPGKKTGVGSHSLLQRIFPTQGLHLGLLHFRQILYHLRHQGTRI